MFQRGRYTSNQNMVLSEIGLRGNKSSREILQYLYSEISSHEYVGTEREIERNDIGCSQNQFTLSVRILILPLHHTR